MQAFDIRQPRSLTEAVALAAAEPAAAYFAGGTTLVDLMKLGVLTPATLIDTSRLPLDQIAIDAETGRIRIGANVRNSDLAWHPAIRQRYPVLARAVLAGASTQLRNMATTAGNLRQRTRCAYFRDPAAACNKRAPGSGCDAQTGVTRGHAVLGGSEHCIAVFPSDMCVALAILDATVETLQPDGTTRSIPFTDFHRLPGDTPARETVLAPGELITAVTLPDLPAARHSTYLKVRDRQSYEFALASAAVLLQVEDGVVAAARIALGGVATIPWRAWAAEAALLGEPLTPARINLAAATALAGAVAQAGNAFKIELGQRTVARALTMLAPAGSQEHRS